MGYCPPSQVGKLRLTLLSQEHLNYRYLAPEPVFAPLPQCGLPGSLTQECFGTGPKSLQCRPGRKRWGGDGFSGPPPYPGPEVTEGLKRGTKNVQSHPDSDPVRGCPLDGTVRARWPCPPVDWSLPGTFWQAQTMQVAGEGRRRGRGGEGREAWLMGQAQGREG